MEDNRETNQKQKSGTLYLISSPIGNNKDFTFRASDVLQKVDLVLGEEMKITAQHLYQLRLDKPIDALNEHNEAEKVPEIIALLKEGKNIALMPDDGTPVVADPGFQLVRACINEDITISPIPGASSILSALICSGFTTNQFLYAGFLSRTDDERRKQITFLAHEPRTVIVMDTPYRMKLLLKSLADVIPDRNAYIGMNLTLSSETHQRGTFAELYEKFKDHKMKVEYVIVFEGAKHELKTFPIASESGGRKVFNIRHSSSEREGRQFRPRTSGRSEGDRRRDNREGGDQKVFGTRHGYSDRDSSRSRNPRPITRFKGGEGEDSKMQFKKADESSRRSSSERRGSRDSRDFQDRRGSHDSRDYQDRRGSRDSRDSQDRRGSRDSRDSQDRRGSRDSRDSQDRRGSRDSRDSQDRRGSRDSRDSQDRRSSQGRPSKFVKSSKSSSKQNRSSGKKFTKR